MYSNQSSLGNRSFDYLEGWSAKKKKKKKRLHYTPYKVNRKKQTILEVKFVSEKMN